jgi:electron transfer flavoprotein beta subunit
MEPVDLVLCGEGSGDMYSQQVGLQLGEKLGWPTTTAVHSIHLAGETIQIERSLEEEFELLEVPLPAVLSLTTDINQPRLATMKEILKASKKPVQVWNLEELKSEIKPPRIEVISTYVPKKKDRKQKMLIGKPEETVLALLEYLHADGAL